MRNVLNWLALVFFVVSCSTYKQNIMLKSTEGKGPEAWKKETLSIERDYVIQKNDLLRLNVFTNNGERIVDPNPELTNSGTASNQQNRQQFDYLVSLNGVVKFPMIGEFKVEGLTLRQAEVMIQKEFSRFFKEPFVHLTFANKRFTILGAPGGQVIPLTSQNITLAEALALGKGLSNDSKAHNIKVVREEKVYEIDLSTIEGFQKGNMIIQPGDIIYVEPVRKPVVEGLRDYSGIVGLIVSVGTLIVLISNLN